MQTQRLAIELQKLLDANDTRGLQRFCSSGHPASIAEALATLSSEEVCDVLSQIEPRTRAEIFSYLEEQLQIRITELLKRKTFIDMMTLMPADERVDFFNRLPEDKQELVFPALAHAEREDIRKLSSYPEGTAGSVMTSDYATLSPELTVSEAMTKLRREAPDKETIYYAYVIAPDRRLLGFASLKDLILARPEKRIEEIMHSEVIFARVDDDQEEAARKIARYDLIALPVINGNDVLVGIITHDDAIDIIHQEHTEDLEMLMAIGGEHEVGKYLLTPSWIHFKNRAYWVVGLAVLGLVSGMIIHEFEGTLIQMMILALYMPMVADTGGNTGSQAATVVVRALALKEIHLKDTLKILFKELRVSLLLGLVLGLLSFGKVLFISHGTQIPPDFSLFMIAFAIALALGLQVVTSTLIGALLPLLAVKMKADPAIVASPALTTIVDITGLLIYFSVAKFLLGL